MGKGDKKTAKGITLTNSLPLGTGSDNRGIFPIISRICHSCYPNVTHSWKKEAHVENIYSLKTLQPGDEILTSYCELYASKQERQEQLDSFKFICQCEVCGEKDSEKLKASDMRRKELSKLYDEIPLTYRINPQLGLAKNRKMLDIFKNELKLSKRTFDDCLKQILTHKN